MAPREKDDSHFSVHDTEGTRSRIVVVDTDGQERKEENFGTQQQGVANNCRVRMHKHACLHRRHPYGVRLGVNVSMCLQRHIALRQIYQSEACGNARDKSALRRQDV